MRWGGCPCLLFQAQIGLGNIQRARKAGCLHKLPCSCQEESKRCWVSFAALIPHIAARGTAASVMLVLQVAAPGIFTSGEIAAEGIPFVNQPCPLIADRKWRVYSKPQVLGYNASESQMSSMYDDDNGDEYRRCLSMRFPSRADESLS